MYYTVSTLWGSRTNKSLGTYNIVLLALNYQMYNIAKHTYITSFWAVHHSTSMRNHAHIKWNTLLETTITSLIHFSGIPREFSKAIDVTLCSGDTQLSQNTHGKAKRAWLLLRSTKKVLQLHIYHTQIQPSGHDIITGQWLFTAGYQGLHKRSVQRLLVWAYPCNCTKFSCVKM